MYRSLLGMVPGPARLCSCRYERCAIDSRVGQGQSRLVRCKHDWSSCQELRRVNLASPFPHKIIFASAQAKQGLLSSDAVFSQAAHIG